MDVFWEFTDIKWGCFFAFGLKGHNLICIECWIHWELSWNEIALLLRTSVSLSIQIKINALLITVVRDLKLPWESFLHSMLYFEMLYNAPKSTKKIISFYIFKMQNAVNNKCTKRFPLGNLYFKIILLQYSLYKSNLTKSSIQQRHYFHMLYKHRYHASLYQTNI